MATISITIPNSILTRVVDGVCGANNYQALITVSGIQTPNPETKQQFATRMLREYAKNCVISYEANVAAEAIRITTISGANQDITIT